MPLLILDLDGTLYESDSLTVARDEKIAEVVTPLLKLPPQAALELVNRTKTQLKSQHLPGSTAHALDHLGLPVALFYDALNAVPVEPHVDYNPLLRPLLQELAKHYTLALLSNSPKKAVLETLGCLGVADCFSAVLAGDESGAKGDPIVILKAVEQLGSTPAQSIIVGDSYSNDIAPSVKAGLTTIWVTGSSDTRDASRTIKSIYELPAALHSLQAR
ncbi:HAD family hydrolase [Candidatus Woesearchaeota archaeon]|nr:HAD family hydrolase [Candidatus Woesearchaeota archaeon]